MEKAKAESEAKYSAAHDDAKVSPTDDPFFLSLHFSLITNLYGNEQRQAHEEHVKELASIRSDLTATQAQLHEAHAAELESLKAVHAIALSDLNADHAKATGDLQDQLDSTIGQGKASGAQIEELTTSSDSLREEAKRLQEELDKVQKEAGSADPALEGELKKARAELQHLNDELAGAKEVSTQDVVFF